MEKITDRIRKIPNNTGVYIFYKDNKVLYVGKSVNIKKRVQSYFSKNINDTKISLLKKRANRIKYIKTLNEFDALLLEAKLIQKNKPPFNSRWRDDKRPLYIKITKEEFPKVTLTRYESQDLAYFYGPFLSSKIAKNILASLRTIFPFCSQKNNKQVCFYHHLNLCNPCPAQIIKFKDKQLIKQKKRYLQNIKSLKNVLDGKSRATFEKLRKKMYKLAKYERFDEAARTKQIIDKLYEVINKNSSILDYILFPDTYEKSLQNDVADLQKVLKQSNIAINKLKTIECYDVSNFAGKLATASMVFFTDGQADKEKYRRFKINLASKQNDLVMLEEAFRRRLNHTQWKLADLILVDGGNNQLLTLLKVANEKNINTPIIALAKRYEEIIIPLNKDSNIRFKKIHLPLGSKALNLLIRVRDEAHRFAIAYHRKLRAKFIPK